MLDVASAVALLVFHLTGFPSGLELSLVHGRGRQGGRQAAGVFSGRPKLFGNYTPTRIKVLRFIPTLKTINNKPAADFWKSIDAGDKPKPGG